MGYVHQYGFINMIILDQNPQKIYQIQVILNFTTLFEILVCMFSFNKLIPTSEIQQTSFLSQLSNQQASQCIHPFWV